MVILLAILMGLGVLFGTEALVVDLGYGMGQQGVMQNSADSAALAAAKILSTSVVTSSPVTYLTTDAQVNAAAVQYAAYNREGAFADAQYATGVEYWIWNGSACAAPASPVFTAGSTASIVAAENGTWNTSSSVPSNTCAITVFATVSYPAMFAAAPPIGQSTESAAATATARIYPSTVTTVSNVWPITHWEGDVCTYTPGSPCTFWGNSGGNFKQLVDFSKDSPIAAKNKPTPVWNLQHMDAWDPTYPGVNQSNPTEDDWDNWFLFGFHGQLNVSDSRCSTLNPGNQSTWDLSGCKNSRLERYTGNHGSNIAQDLYAYIDGCSTSSKWTGPGSNPCTASTFPAGLTSVPAHAEGFDSVLGNYVTMHVFLWNYAENNLDITADLGSTLTLGPTGNTDRVILDKVRCFRFGDGTGSGKNVLASSSVQGYYVSCPSDNPGTNGAPSADANTVSLIS